MVRGCLHIPGSPSRTGCRSPDEAKEQRFESESKRSRDREQALDDVRSSETMLQKKFFDILLGLNKCRIRSYAKTNAA